MMDVPDLGFEPPKALAFYHMLAWGYPDPKKLTPTIPSHEKANRVMQSLVPRLQAAGAMVLDPSPFLFGPSGHCLIQVNEDVIYFDAHHLTISGALRLKPLFAPLFKTQSQP